MEATTAKSCNFILTTYNDGKTNFFYDSTFHLRVPFKPNNSGMYKVRLNECLFRNNEAALAVGDWYEFTFHMTGGNRTVKYTIKKNVYLNDQSDYSKLYSIMNTVDAHFNDWLDTTVTGGDNPIDSLSSINSSNAYIPVNDTGIQVHIEDAAWDDVTKVTMRYSINFGYLFNNLRWVAYDWEGERDDASKSYSFNMPNLFQGGSYMYILKTPLQAVASTYNASNQGYNIIAGVYNTNAYHNSTVQMSSSMEVTTNDLSNFRVELVTDQYIPVNIRNPMYLNLTVSNE